MANGSDRIIYTTEFDDSGVEKHLNNVKSSVQGVDKEVKKLKNTYDDTFAEIEQSAQSATTETKKFNKEQQEVAKNVSTSDKATKSFSKSLVNLLNNIRLGNKGLGDLAVSALSYAKNSITAANSSGKFAVAARVLGIALGGLVAIIGVLIALPLIAYFTRSKEGADSLSVAIAGIRAQFDVFVQRGAEFGKTLVAIFRQDYANAALNLANATRGLGKALSEAGVNARQLRRDLIELESSQNEFIINQAALDRQVQKQRQTVEDSTKSFSARANALKEAGELENQIETERIRQAEENLRIVRTESFLKNGTLLVTKEVAEAEANLENERSKAEQRKFSDLQTLRQIREESRAAADAERKAIEELSKVLQQLNGQINALRLDELSPRQRLQRELELALDEINRFEQETRKAFADRKQQFNLEREFDDLRQLTRRKFEKDLTDLTLEEIATRANAEAKAADERRENVNADLERRLQQLEVLKQIELTRIEALDETGKTEVELTKEKERLKLEAELSTAQQRLRIIEQLRGANSLEAELLGEQIKLLEVQIKRIDQVDLSAFDRFKQKLLSSLKISEQDAQFIGQQLENAFGNLIGGLDAITERQIEQQDRLLASIEKRINDTQKLLEEELRRQEQGFANNADLLKQSLEAQQQEQEKAEQKRAQLEQQAARRRFAINAAEQISEYALAVTKMARANAGFGLPGIALTVAGIALLFRLINQAKNVKFDTPKFRKGTRYVEGPGTTQSDSVRADLSVAEGVLSAPTNIALGGKGVTEKEILYYFKLGKKVAQGDQLTKVMPTIRTTDNELKSIQTGFNYGVMSKAYGEAAHAAAQEMITYWKSRPIEYMTKEGKVIRWVEGNTVREQIIKD